MIVKLWGLVSLFLPLDKTQKFGIILFGYFLDTFQKPRNPRLKAQFIPYF